MIAIPRVLTRHHGHDRIKGSFLYRLLRPELVRANHVPLSSDAFSKWPIEEAHAHNIEVHSPSYRTHARTHAQTFACVR